ncbi:ATP-binding protein [Actinocorallia sp. API 0066]|uniref:ATP-binding protein n=1 Tax=Actinocorallia sp. API 0066 TaxID=2896846 RepID=UPI001E2F4C5A|nr:ATP-binding protein [Actinocorallia sp. API 0066]MCD0448338.1 ATP-binding protein [Actinocorallia sp. API 0066]
MYARSRTWNLDDVPAPVRHARSATVSTLTEWGLTALVDTAALLVSELVTNAVRHGKPPVRLTLAVRDGALNVGVRDALPDPPEPRPGDETGGFGLTVLTALAELTTTPLPVGKIVEARIPLAH